MKFKQYLFLQICFICIVHIAFPQNDTTIHVVQILNPQKFYLNGGNNATFFGGVSRNVLTIKLPENTIRWYYSFSASRDERDLNETQNQLNLYAQILGIITESFIIENVVKILSTPPGSDYADVFLFPSYNNMRRFEEKIDLNPIYEGTFSYNREGSRLNFKSGEVEIKDPKMCTGTQYLGFRNPSLGYGINIWVEVVAIVSNNQGSYHWSEKDKSEMMSGLQEGFVKVGLGENFSKQIAECISNKITSQREKKQWLSMSETDKKKILGTHIQECFEEK
jgi:hypothetical protein